MIRPKIYLVLILHCLLACSKGDSGMDQDNPDPDIDNEQKEEPPVTHPEPALLLFPEDKTECHEGVIIDDSWSEVTFQWNPSQHTDYYELWYRVTGTSPYQKETTKDTEITVRIRRGEQYQWYIVSKNNQSAQNVKSSYWNFYNAGSGKENYAPFPATLINPQDEDVINYSNSSRYYYFEWEASDLDNDPLTFDLYLGTHPDSLRVVKSFGETRESMSNHISSGIKYYWQIKTSDPKGSSSLSEIWSFTRY